MQRKRQRTVAADEKDLYTYDSSEEEQVEVEQPPKKGTTGKPGQMTQNQVKEIRFIDVTFRLPEDHAQWLQMRNSGISQTDLQITCTGTRHRTTGVPLSLFDKPVILHPVVWNGETQEVAHQRQQENAEKERRLKEAALKEMQATARIQAAEAAENAAHKVKAKALYKREEAEAAMKLLEQKEKTIQEERQSSRRGGSSKEASSGRKEKAADPVRVGTEMKNRDERRSWDTRSQTRNPPWRQQHHQQQMEQETLLKSRSPSQRRTRDISIVGTPGASTYLNKRRIEKNKKANARKAAR